MEKPNPPSGKGTTTIPLSNSLRQYLMGSDISADESLQVTPVKASPVIFENAPAKSTPIPENGFFPNHGQNFSPAVYADYTQYSPMFQLGQASPTRNEIEGFENDSLCSDPPSPINNAYV